MVCRDAKTNEIVPGTSPCSICRRLIINAGIKRVVIRNTTQEFTAVYVQEWVDNDEVLTGEGGY